MDETLRLTDTYWDMLKSLSDDIKLRLATRLTASLITGNKEKATLKPYTTKEIDARIDKSLEDARIGRTISGTEMSKRMHKYLEDAASNMA